MEKDYTYSAFISYSSKDEKVAKALWKKLERYRLPAVLQKQYEDIPEKMHVFLDQGDIVPGDTVENALCRELADSKKLIVICSPNSAKSKYVELEVKNFLSLGHSTNDIIPYIIDGEVDKNSPNNCYVPSLLGENDKDTLNGVSVVRDGKWKAFVGVLANLLDVKFDEIYKREKVRKNRSFAVLSALSLVIICFLAVIIWYSIPHSKYYVNYISRWGIPEGVYELKHNEIKKYPTHYKITYQFLRPIKLVHETVSGKYVYDDFTTNERPIYAEFFYKSKPTLKRNNNELDYSVYLINNSRTDEVGNKLEKVYLKYIINKEKGNGSIEFYYDKDFTIHKHITDNYLVSPSQGQTTVFSNDFVDYLACYHCPELLFISTQETISKFYLNYETDTGFIKTLEFQNLNGETVEDKNGVIGFTYKYNSKGEEIERLINTKELKLNSLYLIKKEYDDKGRLICINNIRNDFEYMSSLLCFLPENNAYDIVTIQYDDKTFSETYVNYINTETIKDYTFSWHKTYNKDGSLQYEEIKNDSYRKIEYTYEDNKVYLRISTDTEIHNNTYTYKNGLLESIVRTWDNQDDERNATIIFDYFDNSEIMKTRTILNDVYTEYDYYGRCIKENFKFSNGEESTVLVDYIGVNKSITKINQSIDSESIEKYDFYYDSNENLIHCECRNSEDELFVSYMNFAIYDALYTFYPKIKLKKCIFLDEKSNPIIPIINENYNFSEYIAEIKNGQVINEKYLAKNNEYADMPIYPRYSYMNCVYSDSEGEYTCYYYDAQGNLECQVDYVNNRPYLYYVFYNKSIIDFYIQNKKLDNEKYNYFEDSQLIKYDSLGRFIENQIDNTCFYVTYYKNCINLYGEKNGHIMEVDYLPKTSSRKIAAMEDNYKDFVNFFSSKFDLRKDLIKWSRFEGLNYDEFYISDYYTLINFKLIKNKTEIINQDNVSFTLIRDGKTYYYKIDASNNFALLKTEELIKN